MEARNDTGFPYYTIGTSILVNYHITFDYEANKIEFRPRPEAPPGKVLPLHHYWKYLGITIAGGVFIIMSILAGLYIYCKICRKKKTKPKE